MSCREHLQQIVILDILSQTIFVLLELSIVCFQKPNIESQVLSYMHLELEYLRVSQDTLTDLLVIVYL